MCVASFFFAKHGENTHHPKPLPRSQRGHYGPGLDRLRSDPVAEVPLSVNIQKTMENHHFQWVNPLYLWSKPWKITIVNGYGNETNSKLLVYEWVNQLYICGHGFNSKLLVYERAIHVFVETHLPTLICQAYVNLLEGTK